MIGIGLRAREVESPSPGGCARFGRFYRPPASGEATAREREGLGRRPSARVARIGFGWTVFIHRAWISWERPHTARQPPACTSKAIMALDVQGGSTEQCAAALAKSTPEGCWGEPLRDCVSSRSAHSCSQQAGSWKRKKEKDDPKGGMGGRHRRHYTGILRRGVRC